MTVSRVGFGTYKFKDEVLMVIEELKDILYKVSGSKSSRSE